MEDYWEQQIGFSHIYKNVTSEREHTLQIKKMAIHDPLTGLANRAGMYEYFDKLDQTACAAFMFIDTDNFKYANDRFGHIAGDKLLKDSAELFQKVLGNSYIVRLGGDEFFVILDNSFSLSEIRKMVGQLISGIKCLDGYPEEIMSHVSLSIGILPRFPLCKGVDAAIQRCDVAMYQAKQSGKNQYCILSGGE